MQLGAGQRHADLGIPALLLGRSVESHKQFVSPDCGSEEAPDLIVRVSDMLSSSATSRARASQEMEERSC